MEQYFSPFYDFGYDMVPNYNMPSSNDTSLYITLLLTFLAVSVCAVVLFANYILKSIGLYKIALRRNIDNAFLAFVPVVNSYILGGLCDDINKTMRKTSKNAPKLVSLNVLTLCIAVMSLPVICYYYILSLYSQPSMVISVITSLAIAILFVLFVIYSVYFYISVYVIFKEYSYNNASLYLVLSILFLPLSSLFVFLICNNKSGYELWQMQREQQRVAAETRFDEEFTENSVEEVFSNELQSAEDDQEQTIIDSTQELSSDFDNN